MNEIKREIEVKDFECPFCGNNQSELVKDSMINEETGEVMGFGIDGWECKKCGAENDIGLGEFKKDYRPFIKFCFLHSDYFAFFVFGTCSITIGPR